MAPASEAPSVDWRSDCPISCALDVLGDRWSLLIVRDLLLHEQRTYNQLLGADEGISTNILAARLKLLSGLGLIQRAHPDRPARENPWVLSATGQGLGPIVQDLAAWSSAAFAEANPGIVTI